MKGGVYGHQKDHVEKLKSGLNGYIINDINHGNPTNVSIPNVTNPPSSPSSSSLYTIPSPTRKVLILNDIYQRSLAHKENPRGETVNFSLF